MKDTVLPFHLGSNVMISIKDGVISQISDGVVIKTINVSALNPQQHAAIEAARTKCCDAMVAQGFGTVNR
jgi:hypothetical protein